MTNSARDQRIDDQMVIRNRLIDKVRIWYLGRLGVVAQAIFERFTETLLFVWMCIAAAVLASILTAVVSP